MAILKQHKVPSGAVAEFHIIHRVEVDAVARIGFAGIRSYLDEAAYMRQEPPVYYWSFDIGSDMVHSVSVDALEAFLVQSDTSPLHQGSIVEDRADTLEARKRRRLVEIKRAVESLERGGFWSDYRFFDSDLVAQSRIQGAVQMALIAKSAGQPFSKGWTLADNSTVTLNADEMVAVGLALGEHVNSCHVRGRVVKDLINAATTVEELDAIAW